MRFGGPVFGKHNNSKEWAAEVKKAGYSAAYSPLQLGVSQKTIREYEECAKQNNIVIAEVGAWSNPLSPDKKAAASVLKSCKECLALADELNARCTVNIAGSRGEKWDGPSSLDLLPETFDMVVDMVRDIVDSVKPKRSFYALETMPWMYPNSPESYLKLIKAVDRKQFAVHFDPVNMINSPDRYFKTGEIIKTFVKTLGKYIRSCHAKDIILRDNLTTHLDEGRPGTGNLDYGVYLKEINGLKDKDICVMMEHLPSEQEYREAAKYIRSVAKKGGINI